MNEGFTAHDTGRTANFNSETGNFAANDIIRWVIIDADIDDIVGPGAIIVYVFYEGGAGGDAATDINVLSIRIEFV